MPSDFYKQAHAIRAKFGEKEYDRNQLLPAIMALISKFLKDDKELLRDEANAILDSIEKAENNSVGGLFPYDAHAALGEKQRIKRSAMNLDQHYRRKRIIDANKVAQDTGWANETGWINAGVDALQGHPASTKRSSVIDEDGSKKRRSA